MCTQPSSSHPIPKTPTANSTSSAVTPIRSHPDGVYFCDCTRGDEFKSILAYYSDLKDGGNDNELPTDITNVFIGHTGNWEGKQQGKLFPRFSPSPSISASCAIAFFRQRKPFYSKLTIFTF
jgi:hypothetical protein